MTNFDQPFQDYEILDRVGAGAMGTVFKARHKRLNRIVALKILKPSLARDKRYVERLRREARIVASLSHPHIVTGYDLGEEGGYHFFVMEFVEGKSLRQLLIEWGMFSEDYVLRVARETAMALDHAYQRDVIHRDIKPGNILIDDAGNVKLTDMGLAKGPADLTLTRDGATVGTPMYISPEQARNPQDVDVRSDLYSLGATLYHMATGVPPFSGETMAELITSVLNDNVIAPNEVNSSVSPGMSLVIRKLLAKNLTVRYQTPRELLDDLERIEKEQPPAVDAGRLDADSYEPSRWPRLVLAAMVLSLVIVGTWWFTQRSNGPAVALPSAEEFMAELDKELLALSSPGDRYRRLTIITSERPPGSITALEQRKRQVEIQLQTALNGVIDALEGPLASRTKTWLMDVSTWPSNLQFERERLQPLVRERTGLELSEMPSRVSVQRVTQLLEAVVADVGRRDAGVQGKFERYLTLEVPGRANERLRASDFAGADAMWRTARESFFNGLEVPTLERLPEAIRTVVNQKWSTAQAAAVRALQAAEERTVGALRQQVATTVADLRARLDDGANVWVVREALQRFRSDLGQVWPAAENFRIGNDPWPEVEQQLMSTEQLVELQMNNVNARMFVARCNLAWRAYCQGDAAAALAVLDEIEPATATQTKELEGHRRCLRATQQVEFALLKAIEKHADLVAFRLGSMTPYSLRVQAVGESLRLFGAVAGQREIAMRLTELRIGHLLDTLSVETTGPVHALASVPRALGLTVLRLVADDADGLERHVNALHNADRALVLDYVWPRIELCRSERTDEPISQEALFGSLAKAIDSVEQTGNLIELRVALRGVEAIKDTQCTPDQNRLRLKAKRFLRLYLRRQNLLEDLEANAPTDAAIDVRREGRELVAAVTLPASVLSRDAGDGWQLLTDWHQHGRTLEFAGSKRPWKEQPNLALRGRSGHDARTKKTQLQLELAFPAGDDRYYIIEFDGIRVMLVIAKDNSVQVEVIGGGTLDEDRAQKAFDKALSGAFAPGRAFVIADAPHRLTIEVAAAGTTLANVKVLFEGKELLSGTHACIQKQPADFTVHPFQELHVLRATVKATGL